MVQFKNWSIQLIWKIEKNEIWQFGELKKFNFTIWKINILQFEKLLNILNVETFSKKL